MTSVPVRAPPAGHLLASQNAVLLFTGDQPAPLPGSARCWSRTPSRRSARNAVTPDAVTTLREARHRALPSGRTPGYPVVRTGRGLVSVLPRPVRVRTPGCRAGTVAAMTDRAALISMFDYDARPVTPGVILVGTIGAELGQGQPVMIGAVAAEQRG